MQSLARQSKRSIVRTFAPSLLPTRIPSFEPFPLLTLLYRPSLLRGGVRTSPHIYMLVIRDLLARDDGGRRWLGGRLYTTGKERASIKRIMNRGAASFFLASLSSSLSLFFSMQPEFRGAPEGNISRASGELSTMKLVLLVVRRSRGGCLTRSACYMHYSWINYREEMEIFFVFSALCCWLLVEVIIIIFCMLIGQLLCTRSEWNSFIYILWIYEIFNNDVIHDAYCVIWNTYRENKRYQINVKTIYIYNSIRILFFD